MHPCAQCAAMGPTCCEKCDVLVTRGDIGRVAAHTRRTDFWQREAVRDPAILDQPDDPDFVRWAFDAARTRRILKRRKNGACMFLSMRGCALPVEVRPLVCRLYPLDYTAAGLNGTDSHCPSELTPPGTTILSVLNMDSAPAERWRRQLYEELRTEWEQHAHRDDL